MNTSQLAKWLGVVLLVVGALGFVPGVATDGMLLGMFMVDMVHNAVHLVSGLLLVMMAGSNAAMALKVVGVVYGLVAVLGFMGSPVLGFLHVNAADNYLHLVIAVLALYFGFRRQPMM